MISRQALARALQGGLSKIKSYLVAFNGGADFETPPLFTMPGFCRRVQNYECDISGGYARFMGYERFSGQPSPSAGLAYVLDITLTGSIAVGDTVTGVTSTTICVESGT